MAHHYPVDPVDYLIDVAKKLDEDISDVDHSGSDGTLTADGVVDILDTEEESVERHGQESYN